MSYMYPMSAAPSTGAEGATTVQQPYYNYPPPPAAATAPTHYATSSSAADVPAASHYCRDPRDPRSYAATSSAGLHPATYAGPVAPAASAQSSLVPAVVDPNMYPPHYTAYDPYAYYNYNAASYGAVAASVYAAPSPGYAVSPSPAVATPPVIVAAPVPDDHITYDLSLPLEVEQAHQNNLDLRSDDELWIEAWLAKIGKIKINLDSTVQVLEKQVERDARSSRKPDVRLCDAIAIADQVRDLARAVAELSSSSETEISAEEKSERTEKLGQLKKELSALRSVFENPAHVKKVNYAIKTRRKQRERLRRQRQRRHQEKQAKDAQAAEYNTVIDRWLEQQKEETRRIRQTEALKSKTDTVLVEVTKRKSDAKRQLALVNALIKLRAIREHVAKSRGEKVSLDDAYAFKNLADRLVQIWTDKLADCVREEHRLRTQLEQTSTDHIQTQNRENLRRMAEEWRAVFFGDEKIPEAGTLHWALIAAERDVDTFIAIRKSWDTFLVSSTNEEASRIPIGWVPPNSNPSDAWARYVKSA